MLMLLHENIRFLRAINRYTQKYIAGELDINQSYYSRIERNDLDIPTSLLKKIAEFYELPVQTLLYTDLAKEAKINTKKSG